MTFKSKPIRPAAQVLRTAAASLMAALMLNLSTNLQAQSVLTERQYLSGTGCDDMVEWDFMCTDGANSGTWSKIGVPSCWELQGFGTYQYGMKFYGKLHPEGIASEKGIYKYEFNLPASWEGKQVELVFEASMTDTYVEINGRKAGSTHQGAFYRFVYDVSDRVFFGEKKNRIEVTVSKESENDGVNAAERRGDYWNFGGIFRPVFMLARPAQNIHHVAIDARADGTFAAICSLNKALEGASIVTAIYNSKGKKVGETTTAIPTGSDQCTARMTVSNPDLWTAETPNLYRAEFALKDATGKVLHQESEKFGFRTIEVRQSDGLYINGVKIKVKGVNRHSVRPETGRTLSKEKNIEDVLLIKSMNMNAVRLSHYPADPEFLEACDSLGLYLMSELSGWHGCHETINGQKLVREMVERDVNHPCLIWWSNGNEGGWNDELNDEFLKYDPQQRPVIHPLGNFGGFECMHYRSYGESQDYMRKPEIFMPTEFLHGLYDGGHGAGLYDYWEIMRKHPRCAGGFLWDLADEGVKRVDLNGFIDNCGNYGADGIVGPHHEKEGSYWTVKQIWCPVQVTVKGLNESLLDDKGGYDQGKLDASSVIVENRYDFLTLEGVTFDCSYVRYEGDKTKVIKTRTVKGIATAPGSSDEIEIGTVPADAEALVVKATDHTGMELYTWTFKIQDTRSDMTVKTANKMRKPRPSYTVTDDALTVEASGVTFVFSTADGTLSNVTAGKRSMNFGGGPRFFAYRRTDRSWDQFYNHDDAEAEKKKTTYTLYDDFGEFDKIEAADGEGDTLTVTATYKHGSLQRADWHIAPDGNVRLTYEYAFNGVVDLMGVSFDLPEGEVKSKEWLGLGPYRVWKNRMHGPQLGIWSNEYNDPIPGESFIYPEFKGYFAGVQWMKIHTVNGTITLQQPDDGSYVGVYQPRDGRDQLLYTFPETGISLMQVIPGVRNKVNTTDLNGPSALPVWASGTYTGEVRLCFE